MKARAAGLAAVPGIALAVLFALAAPAAARTACPGHFANGTAPDITRPALGREVRELCFEGFAILHSGVSRTPLAAAEHLTRARLAAARDMRREGSFHEESRLPQDERADLSDYARSGYDRGHMAPSGDMPTPTAMSESFSLANMVPQHPASNRCLWERIETAVRHLVEKEGEAYVVTGPIFAGDSIDRIGGRVLVPTSLFKAVYVPGRGSAAYVTANRPGADWREVSPAELRDLAGLDAFPGLPAALEARALNLPDPRAPPRHGLCSEEGAVAAAPAPTPAQPARGPQVAGFGVTTLVAAGVVAVVLVAAVRRIFGRR
ncbi:DNA/RNA non-specific endonuclease [Roseomonas sp. CCTCC AB2023176]|uniref:DNA/RNA non-specific endonuclease n=1 Tax=Roseomonas sp. CCTCC AB2023176 TaxID=3342640 RepID=UPI0035DE82C8